MSKNLKNITEHIYPENFPDNVQLVQSGIQRVLERKKGRDMQQSFKYVSPEDFNKATRKTTLKSAFWD